ncbi:MAG: hypothetical protein A3G34_12615 [Candidatus Lindowbacteria bacterium RIFCSPLOWO2_12_FULL_62_27]|nr:MAG: hypothetical protein A3I06_15450 [Candidatus Lindowbacteria bacterium RIFCSPLOWO2_02_FULL_62_12]OGH62437.1 MAG: hypothetical protein A3G34_12615 [Candidatus Lindowbacteria bacterium RIFCSPLOWO2_12_FULL_62_27]
MIRVHSNTFVTIRVECLCFVFALVCFTFPVAVHSQTGPILALYNVPQGQYAFAKKLSLNTVVIWPERRQLDEAQAAGVRGIVNIAPLHFPDTAAWKKRVLELKSHPALYAWAIYDEPDLNRKPLSEVAAFYRLMKSLDPLHPVYQAVWNPLRYADYAPYCDILAVVPYVVTRKEPLTEMDLMRVHQSVLLAKNIVKTKPVFAVIQAFAGLPNWPRPPTPEELRAMVAMSLAAGSEGFAFYAYTSAEPWPTPTSTTRFQLAKDTPLMEAIRTVAEQIQK